MEIVLFFSYGEGFNERKEALMSLTLNSQMNSVYLDGLKVLRKYEEEIKAEWEKILLYLRNKESRSAKSAELAVFFFTEAFFKYEVRENDFSIGFKFPEDYELPAVFRNSPFIVSLLENSVHKVIQGSDDHTPYHHQAIQYVFSTLSDYVLTQTFRKRFQIETFLGDLVTSQQIPIIWTAIVKKQSSTFVMEKWFNRMNQDLLLSGDQIRADTIYDLSELLLRQMEEEEKDNLTVLPVSYEDQVILICVNIKDSPRILPFITYQLQFIQKGKDASNIMQKEQMWKDSVLLFNESIMRSKTFTEAVENITAGFVNFLPFERCALFSYSKNIQTGFGLYGHRLDNKAIQNITEELENLPIIQNNLQLMELFGKSLNYLQPFFIQDATRGFPEQYIKQFQLKTVVIAPIFTTSSSKLLGAAILDQGPGKSFKMERETFSALVKFGQSAGEILSRYFSGDDKQKEGAFHFSPREIEVLKLMAEGASTSEAASRLNLSEYTVRDYISAIMQKMDARNRTEAVARAIRKGLI